MDGRVSRIKMAARRKLRFNGGLNVGNVYTTEGMPRNRLRIRPEIAKTGRQTEQ